MTAAYTGNAAYCFSNSLHMCLVGSAKVPSAVPDPGFLECLTGMPFGKTYGSKEPAFWPSGPGFSPEQGGGLDLAVETWHAGAGEVRIADGDAAREALARLDEGLRHGPALVGPVDFGHLSYSPHARHMRGADPYVVALALRLDGLILHDPAGVPYAILPVADLMEAWRLHVADPLIADAHRLGRQEMIQRTLPLARKNANTDPGGPATYGGASALARLATQLRDEVSAEMERHLLGFAFPTAARRTVDAARFLAEGGQTEAAEAAGRQAMLWGRACSMAARHRWAAAADVVDQLAEAERDLAAVL